MVSSTVPTFNTLKDCLEFLEWLKSDTGMKYGVAHRLKKLLKERYNSASGRKIESSLSQFLNHVSKFYNKLCTSPRNKYDGNKSPKDVLYALLQCIPKFLAVMYFLRYHVDEKFAAVGGGDWAKLQVGLVKRSVIMGTKLDKYLVERSGSHDYGVIPGGFGKSDLRHGRSGYYQGRDMTSILTTICEKHEGQFYRDVFVTSVFGDHVTDTSNLANAVRLVEDFCRIFVTVAEDEDLRMHLESRHMCIDWKELRDHCIKLKHSLEKIFKTDVFSFTGYGRKVEEVNKKNIAKKMATWLKHNLNRVKDKLKAIEPFDSKKLKLNMRQIKSSGLNQSQAQMVADYFTKRFFRYGFTFGKNEYEVKDTPYQELFDSWNGAIDMLRKDSVGDLDMLKQILDGNKCQTENEEVSEDEFEDDDLVDDDSEDEVHTTKTHSTSNQGKKAEGAQNQGKKAEGAQNQGKKSEGARNQGKESQGAANQGKKAEGEPRDSTVAQAAVTQPLGVPLSGPASPAGPDSSSVQGTSDRAASPVSAQQSGQLLPSGRDDDAKASTASNVGVGGSSGVSSAGGDLHDSITTTPEHITLIGSSVDPTHSDPEQNILLHGTDRHGGITGIFGDAVPEESHSLAADQHFYDATSIDGITVDTNEVPVGELPADAGLDAFATWEPTRQPISGAVLENLAPLQHMTDLRGQSITDTNILNRRFPYPPILKPPEPAESHPPTTAPHQHVSTLTHTYLQASNPLVSQAMGNTILYPAKQTRLPPIETVTLDGAYLWSPTKSPVAATVEDQIMAKFTDVIGAAIIDDPNKIPMAKLPGDVNFEKSLSQLTGGSIPDPRNKKEADNRKLQLQYADSKLKNVYAQKTQELANEINRHAKFLEQVKKDDDQAKEFQKLLQDVKEELVTLHSNSESIDRTAVGLAALNDRYKITPVIEKGPALNLIEDGIVNKPPTAIQPEEHLKTKLILEAESKHVVRGDVHITVQAPAPSALDDNHGLSIDVPNRPLRDDSYDLDLATFYGHSGNVVIDELKNADSWYGEDKGFSGLPNSNFNLEFTPTFLESAGHDPGMPLNPSRQVSARGVALFPDPNVCTNPWYVPASSTSITQPPLSPLPNSDRLPPPRTVREMLYWFVGLNTYGLIGQIKDYVKSILVESNNAASKYPYAIDVTGDPGQLDATMVTTKLTEACLYSAHVLYKIRHTYISDAFKDFFKDRDKYAYYYSSDPAGLLCQLRDYVYACHHQLEFLKSQCKRDKLSGGWQDCDYGSDITSSNSPLKAFLTDGWDSTFETHPFDPCNLCQKSRVRMGFKKWDLPKKSETGNTLSSILTPSCGGSDPLLTLASYLNCLTRRTPRTTGELVSFFHNLGNSLHDMYLDTLSPLGSALSESHLDCPDWDRLDGTGLQAVRGIRGTESLIYKFNSVHDKDHPRTLSTLVGCSDSANCPQYCSPITYQAYSLYSYTFVHTYLSWVVYLPDRLWESLLKLYYDLLKHCGSGKCTSLYSCTKAMPLLYLHGFTPPEVGSQPTLTCQLVIAKVKEIVNGKPIANLMTAMDDFLYGIREPFIFTLVTLWSTAFFFIANTILYRLDVLRIRSHLIRTKASHVIDVKALLSDSKKMMSLYDANYFDDNPAELLEAT